ncbi:dethiobiotin synthase [Aliidiomarina haloalkalitolerans]|uniref:ATP-dependent dethiobiotin synthetase BioD n=1 Tax=Aliidiomarina haloalkalitolerans TaxID=859059 RepID=A0A432VYD7_9GAMM|nr:dethiobiotin synthase [Aliidiomarina haloalkalitolerans]RUO21694.1 dethiobiotin synthase [Aliidiomarina haloalkalitolerans]
MSECFFVTGTDTDCGKTSVSELVLELLARSGYNTIAMKPVAAGCEITAAGLRNVDALKLQSAATVKLPYEAVNPIALAPAIAPHIAAEQFGVDVRVQDLVEHWRVLREQQPDFLVTEGAGGWLVPLNSTESFPDFVQQTGQDVILVVGMKLGCLNHALLTVAAIEAAGLKLRGWVANQATATPMMAYKANLKTLKQRIQAPLLAEVPHLTCLGDRELWLQRTDLLERLGYIPRSPLERLQRA